MASRGSNPFYKRPLEFVGYKWYAYVQDIATLQERAYIKIAENGINCTFLSVGLLDSTNQTDCGGSGM